MCSAYVEVPFGSAVEVYRYIASVHCTRWRCIRYVLTVHVCLHARPVLRRAAWACCYVCLPPPFPRLPYARHISITLWSSVHITVFIWRCASAAYACHMCSMTGIMLRGCCRVHPGHLHAWHSCRSLIMPAPVSVVSTFASFASSRVLTLCIIRTCVR